MGYYRSRFSLHCSGLNTGDWLPAIHSDKGRIFRWLDPLLALRAVLPCTAVEEVGEWLPAIQSETFVGRQNPYCVAAPVAANNPALPWFVFM